MIMAGLGADGVQPLRIEDLAGREDEENNDGQVVMSKIRIDVYKRQAIVFIVSESLKLR